MNENQEKFLKDFIELMKKYSVSNWYITDNHLTIISHDQKLKITRGWVNKITTVETEQVVECEV
jgi:hypothetical protein